MAYVRPLVLSCALCLAAIVATSSAAAATKLTPLTPVPADGLSRALAVGELSEAEYALERAKALFRPEAATRRYGSVAPVRPQAATLVLRDLALRLDELSPEDRAAAEALLARPSDGTADVFGDGWTTTEAPASPVCEPRGTPRWCVHWVETTQDAPPSAGASGDGIPDWIDGTVAAMEKVFAEQVGRLNFPKPKDDSSSVALGNPNGALDVYLANIGNDGFYGYCTSDDPRVAQPGRWDVSAYCVLDDDFKQSQFPSGVFGQAANKVTIAHEVHHAEQFALDYAEDAWMMESGATAMERVVYPSIHDNYQYLDTSQITNPGIPLDLSSPSSGTVYGNWIFLKHLSERFGGPEIMRRIWRRLDARNGRPDNYSTQGIRHVVGVEDRSLRQVYTGFAFANRRPRVSYTLPGLPSGLNSPTRERYRLGRSARSRSDTLRSKHLSSRWVVFHRRSDAPRTGELVLRLDLHRKSRGAAARAMVVRKSGKLDVEYIWLGPAGNGREVVHFGRRVRRVELLLVNASSRFDCWSGRQYSCSGRALDDGRKLSFIASLR